VLYIVWAALLGFCYEDMKIFDKIVIKNSNYVFDGLCLKETVDCN